MIFQVFLTSFKTLFFSLNNPNYYDYIIVKFKVCQNLKKSKLFNSFLSRSDFQFYKTPLSHGARYLAGRYRKLLGPVRADLLPVLEHLTQVYLSFFRSVGDRLFLLPLFFPCRVFFFRFLFTIMGSWSLSLSVDSTVSIIVSSTCW